MSGKPVDAVFLIIGILMVGIGGYTAIIRAYTVQPQYQRDIGDFALNAADAPTLPEAHDWLVQFNQSMVSQGLTPDMYNSPFSWDKTPQNKMSFQYKYITDLINTRIPYYEKLANSTSCGFNDCYGLALDHFRTELNHNGPADWVAQGAYMIKVGHYYDYYLAAGLILPGLVFAGIGLVVLTDDEDD